MFRATIDACVAAVVGLGYTLRYKPDIDFEMGVPNVKKPGSASLARRDRILAAFENCWPDLCFQDVLTAVWTDYEVTGNAYIELTRNGNGDVDGFRHLKSTRARLSTDYQLVYEVDSGMPVAVFGLYGTGITAVMLKTEALRTGRRAENWHRVVDWTSVGFTFEQIAKAQAEGYTIKESNEVVHLRNYSPHSSYYGEPPILSAIEDYIGSINARLFNISYFNNATVPRMMIILRNAQLSPDTEERIRQFVREQEALDAMNQVLVLTLGEGVEFQIERLSSNQLRDAGFLEYRQACDEAIRRAYRTPASWVGITEGGGRQQIVETNQKYLHGFIAPRQVKLCEAFNRVFRERMNTDDWVLHLNQHQVMDRDGFARFVDIMMRHGVMTINEVRREQGMAPIDGGDLAFITPMGMGVVPVSVLPTLTEAYKTGQADVIEAQKPEGQPGARPLGLTVFTDPRARQLPPGARRELIDFLVQMEAMAQNGTLQNVIKTLSVGLDEWETDTPEDGI